MKVVNIVLNGSICHVGGVQQVQLERLYENLERED